ncbi:hypothetical protein D3C72_2186460 [compost metagenome]
MHLFEQQIQLFLPRNQPLDHVFDARSLEQCDQLIQVLFALFQLLNYLQLSLNTDLLFIAILGQHASTRPYIRQIERS